MYFCLLDIELYYYCLTILIAPLLIVQGLIRDEARTVIEKAVRTEVLLKFALPKEELTSYL